MGDTELQASQKEATRFKLISLSLGLVVLVLLLIGAVRTLDVHLSWGSDPARPDFPAGGPAEFLYLDDERVAAYLAQVNGGTFDTETLSSKLTRSLNAKLAAQGAEAGGSETQESSSERVVKPTDASSYFALLAALDQAEEEEGGLARIRLRRFAEDLRPLEQGRFVSFETSALLSPLYLNSYLAVRNANTLEAIFPESAARRDAAQAFFDGIGESPRAVFALQPPTPANREPFTYLLPMEVGKLTDERSLIKYGGGKFTVVGKVVRTFPEGRRDRIPAYVDSATLEVWRNPLAKAPRELLCRTDPGCISKVREDELRGAERLNAVKASRRRALTSLDAQTAIEGQGAVIIPVAIYK